MSEKRSMAYIRYPKGTGSLRICIEVISSKYYMQDEQGGEVELPKDVANDFATILNNKYKELMAINKLIEEREKKH